jgi:cell division protein ZapA
VGQVSVTLNDRIYRLVCDDGEEDRLVELATYVKAKVEHLTDEIGNAGQERLMLMAALIIADELWDARAETAAVSASAASAVAVDPEPVRRLKSLASKLAQESTGDTPMPSGDLAQSTAKARKRDVA